MKLAQPFVRLPYQFDISRLQQEISQFVDADWMEHPSKLAGNFAIPLVSLNGQRNNDFAGSMQTTAELHRCDYVQQVTAHKGVKLVAHNNVPGRLAGNASELFSRNLFNFLDAFFDKEKKQLALDWEDEIIAGIGLTRDGKIVHPALQPKKAAKKSEKKPAAKKAAAKKPAKKAVKKPAAKKATAKKPAKKAAKGAKK